MHQQRSLNPLAIATISGCVLSLSTVSLIPCYAFLSSTATVPFRKWSCPPISVTIDSSSSDVQGAVTRKEFTPIGAEVNFEHDAFPTVCAPEWIPMELAELAAEDLKVTTDWFVGRFVDKEAYTSCDDDEDDVHECDEFGQYLGPTKWLHLRPEAYRDHVIDEAHFIIWRDVLCRPHSMVNVADLVSKEMLMYYDECIIGPSPSSEASTVVDAGSTINSQAGIGTGLSTNLESSVTKMKVIPASFGLDGFEDAVWEATEDLLRLSGVFDSDVGVGEATVVDKSVTNNSKERAYSSTEGALTRISMFVVAAPDLADPILTEGGRAYPSPQAEFNPEAFSSFSSRLEEKLSILTMEEGFLSGETVQLTAFHPLWRESVIGDNLQSCNAFPYPCIELSISTNSLMGI